MWKTVVLRNRKFNRAAFFSEIEIFATVSLLSLLIKLMGPWRIKVLISLKKKTH